MLDAYLLNIMNENVNSKASAQYHWLHTINTVNEYGVW